MTHFKLFFFHAAPADASLKFLEILKKYTLGYTVGQQNYDIIYTELQTYDRAI